jgi:hypothetical protein
MGRAGGAAVSKRKKEVKNRKDYQFFCHYYNLLSDPGGFQAFKKSLES